MSRSNVKTVIDAHTPISEEFSTLRINTEFLTAGQDIRTMAVISSIRGEGRTGTAVQLGIAYARSGKKTIVVDADFRHPGVHRLFGFEQGSGLSDLLESRVTVNDAIRQTPIGRLSILTAGTHVSHAPELLTSGMMEELLTDLRERYEIVILDTPPLEYIEARILAARCNGAILVVEYGKITKESAEKTKEELARVKTKLIGTVVNKNK
jgi:capsular exopolysaccharide synthesis family protein